MQNRIIMWVIALVAVGAVVYALMSAQRAPAPSDIEPAESIVADSNELDGRAYRLALLNGTEVPEGTEYTLAFHDGSIQAKFCNNMFGGYTFEDGVLQALLASTLMFCAEPEGTMDAETAFGNMIGAGALTFVEDDSLTLTDGETTMVFVE